MRVVLDSNLIISALITGASVPARVLEAWRRGRFHLVLSEEQLEELRRVTRYERVRPLISSQAAGVLLNELRAHAHMLADLPHVDRSPDPADNFLLAMAQAGEADVLVTGDKHDLLSLKAFQCTRIITARQFLGQLGEKKQRLHKQPTSMAQKAQDVAVTHGVPVTANSPNQKQGRPRGRPRIWCISQLVIGESAFPDLLTR